MPEPEAQIAAALARKWNCWLSVCQPLSPDVLQFGTGEARQFGDAVSSCNPC
jgi:hypothetical protein